MSSHCYQCRVVKIRIYVETIYYQYCTGRKSDNKDACSIPNAAVGMKI